MKIYLVTYLSFCDGEITYETYPFDDIKKAENELNKIINDMFQVSYFSLNYYDSDTFEHEKHITDGYTTYYKCYNKFNDCYFEIVIDVKELK